MAAIVRPCATIASLIYDAHVSRPSNIAEDCDEDPRGELNLEAIVPQRPASASSVIAASR